jgi:hypothetical protein
MLTYASKTMRKRFRYSVYLLYWYKKVQALTLRTHIRLDEAHAKQFTCFTGTKVQILTLRTHIRLDEAHAKALAPLAFAAMAKAEV